MSREQFNGDWNQIKGKIKENWGKLMGHNSGIVAGRRDQLIGHVQKSYGALKANRLQKGYKAPRIAST